MGWRRLNGDRIIVPIEIAVEEAILSETAAGHQLKICIGTDSQAYSKYIEYATVIVFLRKERGGFMFIEEEKTYQPISMRQRLMTEVAKSIDIAYHLAEMLIKHSINMEVHVDINTDPQFKSNVALNEAAGYIKGMGFEFKAKPEAFASTSCANKIV